MAFLAKQFMSLLLLLVISRLILSTHAGRQHFSQFGRATTTTTTDTDTNPTYQQTDNREEQPTFHPSKDEPHGLGTPQSSTPPTSTSTSFLPSNYDPYMYTTSKETQKNKYDTVQKNDDLTVAEKYGAYNSFSNSKFDEQQNENKEETPNAYSYKGNNKYNSQFPQDVEPTKSQKYQPFGEFNDQYNKKDELTVAQKYDKSNEFYNNNNNYNKFGGVNGAKYITETPPTAAAMYRYSKANQENNEDVVEEEEPLDLEEEEDTNNRLPNKFYSKNKYNNNNKYEEQNPQQYNKINGDNQQQNKDDWAQTTYVNDPYKKKPNAFTTAKPGEAATYFAETDDELNKLLGDDPSANQFYGKNNNNNNKYWTNSNNNYSPADSESYSNTNNDWKAWRNWQQKQEQKNQEKQGTDSKHFAYTDAELNALLDEDEKKGEDEPVSEPVRQGMSDTRWKDNQKYYQATYDWTKHTNEFANAFSGDALSYATKNSEIDP